MKTNQKLSLRLIGAVDELVKHSLAVPAAEEAVNTLDELFRTSNDESFDAVESRACTAALDTLIKTFPQLRLAESTSATIEAVAANVRRADPPLNRRTWKGVGVVQGHPKRYAVYSSRTSDVEFYTARELNAFSSLMEIEEPAWWSEAFPARARGAPANIPVAASFVMGECQAAGVFNDSNKRGCGVWRDRGSVVVADGKHVHDLSAGTTKLNIDASHEDAHYVNSVNRSGWTVSATPATPTEGQKLVDALQTWNWGPRKETAELFAGHMMCMAVCGALAWRPYAWVTGGSANGKSTLLRFVEAVLAGIVRKPVNASAAAMFRDIKSDARAVLFDEAETGAEADREKFRAIVGLARSATDGDGRVDRATPGDTMHTYYIRYSFLFASIADCLTEQQDINRFTKFQLHKPTSSLLEHERRVDACLALSSNIKSRAFHRAQHIIDAAVIFKRVIQERTGDGRLGSLLGHQLAGAWVLLHDDAPTEASAGAYMTHILGEDFAASHAEARVEADTNTAVLEHITSNVIDAGPMRGRKSIGELIHDVLANTDSVAADAAKAALRNYGVYAGIKVRAREGLFVAFARANHAALNGLLKSTPWYLKHADFLSRIPGAIATHEVKIARGATKKCVLLPAALFMAPPDPVDPSTPPPGTPPFVEVPLVPAAELHENGVAPYVQTKQSKGET